MSEISDETLDNAPLVCVLKDSYGAFLYTNRLLERLFHLSTNSMQGKTEYHIMSDTDAAAIRRNDQQVLTTGQDLSAIEYFHMDDGTRSAWMVKKFRIIDQRRKYLGVLGLRLDKAGKFSEADVQQVEELIASKTDEYKQRMVQLVRRVVQGLELNQNAAP